MEHISNNKTRQIGAFLIVILMSVLTTIIVMAGVQGEAAIPAEPSLYTGWTVIAGAIGGGTAAYAARGWLGAGGLLGHSRAVLGMLAITFLAAVITGGLIFQIKGAFYAPVLLTTAFLARPILAVLWFGGLFAAHMLMRNGRILAFGQDGHDPEIVYASSQLSPLTQAQLYDRR
ncbi:MAG: hypothetical protein ACSHW1_10940 [Yoonia sp.]|uniref:hypothetical protein n=1 Tax=Yoonia sp. TaxID=2212373 RepID=UPI003EF40A58